MREESAELIRAASDAQVAAGTRGGVGEIGVHHGRLFILLYLLLQQGERALAVDVFEAQEHNVDGSGQGDRAIFEGHLRRLGADMGRITVIARSSLEVRAEEILGAVGPVRLFSVDGGHTTATALNDLALAEATLARGGVVALDDAFTATFPGVAAAAARYLLGAGRLVPFAISPEKVLLTQPEHHDRLMGEIAHRLPDLVFRHEEYFGHEVALVRSRPALRERLQLGVARTGAYRRLRSSPLAGPVVERLRPVVLGALRR